MDYKYFLKQLAIQVIGLIAAAIIGYTVTYYFNNKEISILHFFSCLPCFFGCAIAIAYQLTKLKERPE